MPKASIFLLIVFLATAISFPYGRGSELAGHKIISLQDIEYVTLSDLMQLGIDILGNGQSQGEIIAHVDGDQYTLLQQMPELTLKVINDDLQSQVDHERRRISIKAGRVHSEDTWFNDYHSYEDIKEWYRELASKYKDRMEFVPCIGKTHEGRDIFAVHINFTPKNKDKKQIWIQGLIHAREWISGAVVQYLSKELVDAVPRLAEDCFLRNVEFIIIPVVNPDGYAFTWTGNRLWRKNMAPGIFGRGVDLNRNFNDHWGQGGSSKIPISDTYQGPSAGSEPETRAIQSYFQKHHNIVGAIDWHCYSQLILYPYGWTFNQVPNYNQYQELTERMAKAFSLNGNKYIPQQSYNLYPTSGSATDWFVSPATTISNRYLPFSLAIELPPSPNKDAGFIFDPKHITSAGEESWAAFVEFVKYSAENAPIRSLA